MPRSYKKPTVVQLKRSKLWVIIGCPWPDMYWCGPYKTQKEAKSLDCNGLKCVLNSIKGEKE